MAPRKRRTIGRIEGLVNTCGFAALPDEIYLEIISYFPSVPIPTTMDSELYPEIRASRHEILLSLSQTSHSLRRVFLRYLWQRIEVREGMKIGDKDDILNDISFPQNKRENKNYATELVRQLEIVTIRNPQLAQYVNYLDVFIGEYSIEAVLAELARCLALFSNLHTVQIDFTWNPRRKSSPIIFDRAFKKYSYPQIRTVSLMSSSVSFSASCPQAQHVSLNTQIIDEKPMTISSLQSVMNNCPHMEMLDLPSSSWIPDVCTLIVNGLLNLRTIQIMVNDIPPRKLGESFFQIDTSKKLSHLQTVIICWIPSLAALAYLPFTTLELNACIERVKEDWIAAVKPILIQVQLRDNLEKTIVVRNLGCKDERRISITPQ